MHHFKAMGEFKLELQSGYSGNAQFGANTWIFCPVSCVTSKFNEWPSKTIGHLFYTMSSFVHHLKAMCEFKLELQSSMPNLGQNLYFVRCDLEIWPMTFKNNRTPLLCYFKFCASFRHHCWIQMELQCRNVQFGSKSKIFLDVWPWNLTDDLEKQ